MNIRQILVSTDVFAALWTKRQAEENSENAILERMLDLPKGPPMPPALPGGPIRIASGDGGIHNRMFDVHFPEGFEIFRIYKGRNYSATVQGGRWIMNGQSFPSLFALSMAIIDSRENPWMHWKFRSAKGHTDFISTLRRIPPELDETQTQAEAGPSAQKKKSQARTKRNAHR
jgi:hypothetical protein